MVFGVFGAAKQPEMFGSPEVQILQLIFRVWSLFLTLYRFGEATLLPAQPQDSPFATITVTSNGTLETIVRYQ